MTETGASGRGGDLRFAIIGAGISGILIAIKLLERGYRDLVVLEKGDRLGGTWRDNVYPGVACDVAAHLYVYSFAPNPKWTSRYAGGAAIWRYYRDVALRYGVLPYIRYGKEVAAAEWDGAAWRLTTADGERFAADVVIAAAGRLHHPVVPEIAGAASFAGPSFHTARWDASTELAGKRVGLIGTGSTATQIIAATAGAVRRLSVFQRTAQWVYPLPNTPVPWWKRIAFRLSPTYLKRYYHRLRGETEARGAATAGDPEARALRDRVCHDALASIRDPELRARLTPDYEVGCKRLVFSPDFYAAIQQPTVEVVTSPIERIEPRGIVTGDGALHELDVLVYATGFDAHAYLRPMRVTGPGGVTLDEVWRDLPVTYRSLAIPRMPNFFLLNGPYSPGGTASVVGIVEVQADYVLRLIERIAADDVLIAPRGEAAAAWLDEVRARARATLWGTGGCKSWYLDRTGTPTLDPSTLSELAARLAAVAWDDFVVAPRTRPPATLDEAA